MLPPNISDILYYCIPTKGDSQHEMNGVIEPYEKCL